MWWTNEHYIIECSCVWIRSFLQILRGQIAGRVCGQWRDVQTFWRAVICCKRLQQDKGDFWCGRHHNLFVLIGSYLPLFHPLSRIILAFYFSFFLFLNGLCSTCAYSFAFLKSASMFEVRWFFLACSDSYLVGRGFLCGDVAVLGENRFIILTSSLGEALFSWSTIFHGRTLALSTVTGTSNS